MDHIAIDLGGRESQICTRSEDGTIIEERRWPTPALERYLKDRPPARVIVEASAEAFSVADAATALGHQVRVVSGTLVRSLGVGARGIKTDQRDARTLSEVSTRIDLPSVHVPSDRSRQRQTLCGMREALVESRTKLLNTVQSWLRSRRWVLATGAAESFAERVRKRLTKEGVEMPAFVRRQLDTIVMLTEQVVEADRDLKAEAKGDEVCRRLMTVPGVGPVTAVRFVAALDQVERFEGAHAVESYLGLTPGENSSSTRVQRTSITRAGSPKMRWALVQACWTMWRVRPHDPMVQWAVQVAQRRGKRIAIVAMARKLTGVLYAMWRDGTRYDPRRAAETPGPVIFEEVPATR